jgi:lysozyme
MSDNNRIWLTVLVLSAAGFVGMAVDEGYTQKAVPDPVKGWHVPTIGFGTTGPDVRPGDATTPPKAMQRMLRDVKRFEGAIKACVTVPLYQREYDAYVNLAYNIGPQAFCASTLVRRLNEEDYEGACHAILMWRRVGVTDCSHPQNRTCPGLWARRQRLHAQCLGEGAPNTAGAAR